MAKTKPRLTFAETYRTNLQDPQAVALADGRAVLWGIAHDGGRLQLFGAGAIEELCAPALPKVDGNLRLFRVDAGVALISDTFVALWPELVAGAAPRVMPISNPEVVHGAERYVRKARQVPGESTALVLITRRRNLVEVEALCFLDWDGAHATWRGQPSLLSWEDIPHTPKFSDPKRPPAPYIRDALPRGDGKALVHQTGKLFLGDGGDVKYGMDWSMICEVDVSTGRSRRIADVAHGYGSFTADEARLAVSAMRANKVDLFALDGTPAGSFRYKEEHVSGDREVYLGDIHQSHVWLLQGYGIGRAVAGRNVHHCTFD